MKKCGRCAKPAVVHITELKQGEAHPLHLCESCAKEYLSLQAPPDSEESDDPDIEEDESELASEETIHPHLVCPNCGITFAEFRSQGRLGCPQDYNAFRDEIQPLLENIHGETQHCGKVPKRAPRSSQTQFELIKLRNRLRTAIEEENYEEAAHLRDQIQDLETQLKEEGSASSG